MNHLPRLVHLLIPSTLLINHSILSISFLFFCNSFHLSKSFHIIVTTNHQTKKQTYFPFLPNYTHSFSFAPFLASFTFHHISSAPNHFLLPLHTARIFSSSFINHLTYHHSHASLFTSFINRMIIIHKP